MDRSSLSHPRNRSILARWAMLLAFVALIFVAVSTGTQAQASSWPGCASYQTQPEAQAAWEGMGRPAQADGDDDGKVCESLPASSTGSGDCTRRFGAVRVKLDRSKYPLTAAHVEDATRSRFRGGLGYPKVLHIDRAGASVNRAQAIRNWERVEGHNFDEAARAGMDRDEYPMAMSRQGGRYRGRYAHVRLVPASDNRGAGASVGMQLRRYCNGQAFRIVIVE